MIYDRNKKVFALSLKVSSVYAEPRIIDNKHRVAGQLASVLNLDQSKVLERINRDKLFVWVKRKISEEEAAKVTELKLPGVGLLKENKRYYPNNTLASHVLGFVGIDDYGLEGLERVFNKYLTGEFGWRSLLRDAKKRMLPAFEYELVPAVDGYNVQLTIDEVIQHIVEEELENAFKKHKARGASIVVMDPNTGEIYALANRPCYDPNFFRESTPECRRNRAVCDFFEPGSIFKVITASAALEEKVVSLEETFFCENGKYRIGGHTLHDHKPHGNLSFVEIIEKSSNIGVAKVAHKLGEKALYKYIQKFKFGTPTGVELSGESGGMVRPVSKWSKYSLAAIPMGHEIAVTVLQMSRAMSAIANGGYLVSPYIVKRIIDNNGEVIREFGQEQPAEQIISKQTSDAMRQILKRVVVSGTGRRAAIKGYSAGGKTGTAQKIDPNGGYSHSKFMASFIGFVPVENPRFVIAVVFDEPRPYYYGGLVCGPVFKNIAEKILKYMEVPEIIETSGEGK
ncbi:MAG: hypothetical protein GY853_04025 [PVC group bacterium]|nr:hypothetical protein [PVC group bacterium]